MEYFFDCQSASTSQQEHYSMDINDILETETSAMTGADMTHDNGDTSSVTNVS